LDQENGVQEEKCVRWIVIWKERKSMPHRAKKNKKIFQTTPSKTSKKKTKYVRNSHDFRDKKNPIPQRDYSGVRNNKNLLSFSVPSNDCLKNLTEPHGLPRNQQKKTQPTKHSEWKRNQARKATVQKSSTPHKRQS